MVGECYTMWLRALQESMSSPMTTHTEYVHTHTHTHTHTHRGAGNMLCVPHIYRGSGQEWVLEGGMEGRWETGVEKRDEDSIYNSGDFS